MGSFRASTQKNRCVNLTTLKTELYRFIFVRVEEDKRGGDITLEPDVYHSVHVAEFCEYLVRHPLIDMNGELKSEYL